MAENKSPAETLIGRELSSVEFVRDYLQLRFDGPRLDVITDPELQFGDQTIVRTDSNFCNEMISLIGKQVIFAEFMEDEIVRIQFTGDRNILISLKPADHHYSEAVIFDAGEGNWWVW